MLLHSRLIAFPGVVLALVVLGWSCGTHDPTQPSGDAGGPSLFIEFFPVNPAPLVPGMTLTLSVSVKDASGRYTTCSAPVEWRTSNAAVATVDPSGLLRAVGPGSVVVSAACLDRTTTMSFHVAQAVTLSGTVTDDSGVPLAGSHLWIQDSKFGKTTTTDASGRYAVPDMALGTSCNVIVSKDGYETVSSLVVVNGDTVRDFILRVGVQITGRTSEAGIGGLPGVRIEVVAGVNVGQSAESSGTGVTGGYTLRHLIPGTMTLRASKAGYDTVEQSVTAMKDTSLDFTLRASYGTCLVSVVPLTFDLFPSAGGDASVTVTANAGRTWAVTSAVPWIQSSLSSAVTGSGTAHLTVLPADAGATDVRTGVVRVACNSNEGQNVVITQLPNCRTTVNWAGDSPTTFPAAGGTGHVLVTTGTPNCRWHSVSQADWIVPVGAQGNGLDGYFMVRPNATGDARTGTIVIGEIPWPISQRGPG